MCDPPTHARTLQKQYALPAFSKLGGGGGAYNHTYIQAKINMYPLFQNWEQRDPARIGVL